MRFSWPAAAALYALLSLPANAQWQGSIAVGTRSATHAEYDLAGRQLVREHGWLPGASLDAAYRQGSLRWFGGADWYRGDIDYAGRTQAGVAAASTTSTSLAAAHLGASYALGNYYALAALEIDRWQRDILGTAAGAGLQESYRSTRLLLGFGTGWRPAAGTISAEAAVILAAPERMRIGFSGLVDPVSLDTRRGRGLRLETAFQPAWASYLQVQARADWLTVPRSAAAPLTANGAFRGTVTQPEHTRKAFTVALAYLF
jgi:hypothetical protein